MFWALAAGAIDTRGFQFEQVLQDIQTLNEWALEGRLEVTATSLHAYPFVQDRYALLPHGASIGCGLRADPRRARAAHLRAAALRRDRRPGADDDRVPHAAARARRVRAPRAALRPDPRRGLVRPRRRGARDPRGPAHLRVGGAPQGARPRRVVAARDRAAAAARRQPRPPRRRRADGRPLGRPARLDPGRARQPPRGDALRDAVRPRDRRRHERALRRHVRERADVRLRRRGTRAVEELLRRGEAIGAFPEPVRLDYVS